MHRTFVPGATLSMHTDGRGLARARSRTLRHFFTIALTTLLACGDNPREGREGAGDANVIGGDAGSQDSGNSGNPGGDAGSDGGPLLGGDAGSDTEAYERILRKLRECGVLGQDGKHSGNVDPYYYDRCGGRCLLKISCDEVKITWCATGAPNPQALACISRCEAPMVTCAETMRGGKRCDTVKDCADGSDEADCFYFKCANGSLIRDIYRCDGEPHCSDASDEKGCAYESFKCADGVMPPMGAAECNGMAECADSSDERDCVQRGLGFACADGQGIVPIAAVCDSMEDCMDGSDENQGCAARMCRP